MILIGSIVVGLLVSLTFSVPTCDLSMWVNRKDHNCSGTPKATYIALHSSENCTMLHTGPYKMAYKLIVNEESQIVEKFDTYEFKNCDPNSRLFFINKPALSGVCNLLHLVVDPDTYMVMGSLLFNCKH